MASKLTSSQQNVGGLTISTRRGMSAKGREKAILANKESQPPPQDANENPQATGMNQTKNLLTKRKSKPAYMQSLNEAEKAENFKIIDNMSKKITFLKNPRYQENKAPILLTQVSSVLNN